MAVAARTIATGIQTQLSAVTQLKTVVIGRDPDHSAGFPFARVYLIGINDELADQKSFFRTYTYAIEIIQEISNKSKQNAELDWEEAIDYVMTKLNHNWQLGVSVEKTMFQASPARTVEINGGPMVALPIQYSVQTLVQTT